MSDWHFGMDYDMWLYPPVDYTAPDYDFELPEPIEAANIEGTLLVNAEDAIEQVRRLQAENAKLRGQVERLQPKDREGNVLDIADTVSMLRSEHDGDHEWNDVVVELVLTKWGGDRWIVRGSRGEAWACDCSKTGRDEDAYEDSDDAQPIANPTLMECENAKLRKLVNALSGSLLFSCSECWFHGDVKTCNNNNCGNHKAYQKIRELGIEVDE